MNAFAPFTNIFTGWGDLLAGKDTWRDKLPGNAVSIVAALFVNLVCVIAVMSTYAALSGSVPSLISVLINLAFAGILIAAIWLVIVLTRIAVRFSVDSIQLLVPAIHALSFLLLLQFLMSLFGGTYVWAIYGVFAYMMFRLARTGAGISFGVAAAFAILCVIVLVGLPYALYMLLAAGSGPI